MTVKQILYSLQNCSLGQSAARAPTPATPHHPQFPHKMRRRHLESVSAAHFYVEIVDRVPLPRCGGGGRGRGQMRLRLPLERICAQYGFRFFG